MPEGKSLWNTLAQNQWTPLSFRLWPSSYGRTWLLHSLAFLYRKQYWNWFETEL